MIEWLKRKIRHWSWGDIEMVSVSSQSRKLDSEPIRINIYRGSGGLAVETSIYNKAKDEHIIGLHIVHDDDNIGERLSKIITVESIKVL
jgi:hypothetical protein